MCLEIIQGKKAEIAKKRLIFYKLVRNDLSSNIYHFDYYKYIKKGLPKVKFSIHDCLYYSIINEGYHFYTKKQHVALQNRYQTILKIYVPKGTKYYINNKHGVAEKIVIRPTKKQIIQAKKLQTWAIFGK